MKCCYKKRWVFLQGKQKQRSYSKYSRKTEIIVIIKKQSVSQSIIPVNGTTQKLERRGHYRLMTAGERIKWD